MFKGSLCHVFFMMGLISSIKAAFDFKLKYCRFKCDDECGAEEELRNPVTNALNPTGYYWRDYYGVIPSDAYRLGHSNQYPQTYIGMVFNPSKNGSFVTTIIEGLDYVYSVLDGEVTKLTRIIQILCTKNPERLVWIKLTPENVKTMSSYKYVEAGYHRKTSMGSFYSYRHYVTKFSKCSVTYAGSVSYLNGPMEYALMDGTVASTKQVLWLIYKTTLPGTSTSSMNKERPFISHHYEYNIRKGSIIPSFFKQLNVGPCSVTCTNEDTGQESELKKNKMAANAMLYYWKPKSVWNKEEALPVGKGYFSPETYLGQVYSVYNWYDVGLFDGKRSYTTYIRANAEVEIYYQVLSTNYPDMFEWINSTENTFKSLDKSRMIRGGEMDNGTQIFAGRQVDVRTIEPGSIRVFENYSSCTTAYGPYDDFQVLMVKEEKQK